MKLIGTRDQSADRADPEACTTAKVLLPSNKPP